MGLHDMLSIELLERLTLFKEQRLDALSSCVPGSPERLLLSGGCGTVFGSCEKVAGVHSKKA